MTLVRSAVHCVVLGLLLATLACIRQSSAVAPLLVGSGPPQFPADPRMFMSAKEIQQRIAQADADITAGKMYSGEPLVLQGPFRATMEWRNTAQKGIHVHETDAELFVILERSGAMLLGGILVNPKRAHTFPWEDKVEGATTHKVAKGDMVMIPPNTPHTVSEVDGKPVLWSMHLPMPPASGATPPAATAHGRASRRGTAQ